jgi:hypothetical protein
MLAFPGLFGEDETAAAEALLDVDGGAYLGGGVPIGFV